MSGSVQILTYNFQNNVWTLESTPLPALAVAVWYYNPAQYPTEPESIACTTSTSSGSFSVTLPEKPVSGGIEGYDLKAYTIEVEVDPFEAGVCGSNTWMNSAVMDMGYYTNSMTGLVITDNAQFQVWSYSTLGYFDAPTGGSLAYSTGTTYTYSAASTWSWSAGIISGSQSTASTSGSATGENTQSGTGSACTTTGQTAPNQASCVVGLDVAEEVNEQFAYMTTSGEVKILANYVHGLSNGAPFDVQGAPAPQTDPYSYTNHPSGGTTVCNAIADAVNPIWCSYSTANGKSETISGSIGLSHPVLFDLGSVGVSFSMSGTWSDQSTQGWTLNLNQLSSGCQDWTVWEDPSGVAHAWPTGSTECAP